MRTKEDFLNGQLLLIDKPLGWSSFQAVNKLKHAIRKADNLKKIKIGHAGTLDPLATGLLVICTGKFTKRINEIQAAEKEYTGVITLGATTPCYDLEKEVNEAFPTDHITEELIQQTAKSFLGEQEQVAPIHSAKKIDGKRAYEYAREGEEVVIKSNTIDIKEFEVEVCEFEGNEILADSKINQEKPYQNGIHVQFRIVCSKGTYIRAIARDFGEKLNSGGYLSKLVRTKIGDFNVVDAITIDEVGSLFD